MSLIRVLEILSGKENYKKNNKKTKRKIISEREKEKIQLERKLWEMAEEYEEDE